VKFTAAAAKIEQLASDIQMPREKIPQCIINVIREYEDAFDHTLNYDGIAAGLMIASSILGYVGDDDTRGCDIDIEHYIYEVAQ
jgi:hypothetical protein